MKQIKFTEEEVKEKIDQVIEMGKEQQKYDYKVTDKSKHLLNEALTLFQQGCPEGKQEYCSTLESAMHQISDLADKPDT